MLSGGFFASPQMQTRYFSEGCNLKLRPVGSAFVFILGFEITIIGVLHCCWFYERLL